MFYTAHTFANIAINCFHFVAVPSKPNKPIKWFSTSSTVSLRWNTSGQGTAATNYTVTWSSDTNNERRTGITGTSANITGLNSNTDYTFKLIAVNNGGESQESDPTHVVTGKKTKLTAYNFFFCITHCNVKIKGVLV